MPNPNTAHEPSMEEILASIRQIISEDSEGAPADAPNPGRGERDDFDADPPQPIAVAASSAQPSDGPGGFMKQSASEHQASAPQGTAAVIAEPVRRAEVDTGPRPSRMASAPREIGREPEERSLLSRDSDTVVSGAFNALAHTILAQNARTLEGLVSDMVRPMLKDWLDENLPSLVERLVREEIERVSRGRR